MDRLEKALQRLGTRDRDRIREVLVFIKARDWHQLDIQKLKGHADIYRVRKGDIRIIFRMHQEDIIVLAIERRSEKTYRDF